MTEVEITAGICGFTTIVTARNKGNYTASFKLESQCPNWQKVKEILNDKDLNMMTELFRDKKTGSYHSEILNTALETIPHISCPVISGILKTLEVSVGLALPQDAVITFRS